MMIVPFHIDGYFYFRVVSVETVLCIGSVDSVPLYKKHTYVSLPIFNNNM